MKGYYFFKNLFDTVFATIILLVFGWVILICALVAYFDTGLSGFYLQKRIGKKGHEFLIYKIRTMRLVKGFDSTVTTKKDPRVSTIGNFFRKFKLDELPQIINVLKGEMSLVGPRPTVKADFDKMSVKQKKRFLVKPGITGLAQVEGNTSLSWPDRIKLDIKYIDELSFWNDFKILFRTIKLIITNRAETHPYGEDEWQ